MTTRIDTSRAKEVIEQKIIRKSIEVVDYHVTKLEENFDQLENIYRLNVSKDIKKHALQFMEKQDKLIQISNDLKARFQSLRPLQILHAAKVQNEYDLDQLTIELGLLNEMHFRLKKTYFTFIHKYSNQRPQTLLMIA